MLKKVYNPKQIRPLKVLMMSNGPEYPTGYGRVLREIAVRLSKDKRFDIVVFNENAFNRPDYSFMGLRVTCPQVNSNNMGDLYRGLAATIERERPDVLWVLEDSFTLTNFGFPNIAHLPVKKVFYIPLDGANVPSIGVPSVRSMDKIVSMSKFTQHYLEREGFESEMIWHGVDTEQFYPASPEEKKFLKKQMGLDENDFLIYNYGRNTNIRKNNQGLMLTAAKYLKTAPKNHKVLIHTLNPDIKDNDLFDYKERILSLDFEKNVLDRILFSPFRENRPASEQEVVMMMRASDLVITTSIGEGFGLIMAEAMACGIPVISNSYTTPKELLEDSSMGIGARGWLVPSQTPFVASLNTEHAYTQYDRFADVMSKVVANPAEMAVRGSNGRYFAERHLNWEYLVEEWKDLLLNRL